MGPHYPDGQRVGNPAAAVFAAGLPCVQGRDRELYRRLVQVPGRQRDYGEHRHARHDSTPALEHTFREWARTRNWGDDWAEIERRAVVEMFPNPTGRVGRVEEIADMVAFLASPLAGFVNGANIRVDGGRIPTIN